MTDGRITISSTRGFLCHRCNHIYHNRTGREPKDYRCSRCKNHKQGEITRCMVMAFRCHACGANWFPKPILWQKRQVICKQCGNARPMTDKDFVARRTVTFEDGARTYIEPEIPVRSARPS